MNFGIASSVVLAKNRANGIVSVVMNALMVSHCHATVAEKNHLTCPEALAEYCKLAFSSPMYRHTRCAVAMLISLNLHFVFESTTRYACYSILDFWPPYSIPISGLPRALRSVLRNDETKNRATFYIDLFLKI